MARKNKNLLDKLFEATISELLKRVEEGSASPADLSVARQLLKDNNITHIPSDKPVLRSLVESMPFDESEE
jgi:hypothetical protein